MPFFTTGLHVHLNRHAPFRSLRCRFDDDYFADRLITDRTFLFDSWSVFFLWHCGIVKAIPPCTISLNEIYTTWGKFQLIFIYLIMSMCGNKNIYSFPSILKLFIICYTKKQICGSMNYYFRTLDSYDWCCKVGNSYFLQFMKIDYVITWFIYFIHFVSIV